MILNKENLYLLAYIFKKDRSSVSKLILDALRNNKSNLKISEAYAATVTNKIEISIQKLKILPTNKANGAFIKSTINQLENIFQKCSI